MAFYKSSSQSSKKRFYGVHASDARGKFAGERDETGKEESRHLRNRGKRTESNRQILLCYGKVRPFVSGKQTSSSAIATFLAGSSTRNEIPSERIFRNSRERLTIAHPSQRGRDVIRNRDGNNYESELYDYFYIERIRRNIRRTRCCVFNPSEKTKWAWKK